MRSLGAAARDPRCGRNQGKSLKDAAEVSMMPGGVQGAITSAILKGASAIEILEMHCGRRASSVPMNTVPATSTPVKHTRHPS
jgi:hypothetical protein